MSFYGNITNVPVSGFTFDKYYANRYEMSLGAANDGIFIGRYAAIEYNQKPDINIIKENLSITYNDNNKIVAASYKGEVITINESDNEEYKHYKINSKIDDIEYNDIYDSTGWVKEKNNSGVSYKEIADLNGVVPSFDMALVPPTAIPEVPHFDEEINKVAYKLHQQPQWGFRIKEDENGEINATLKIEYTEGKPYVYKIDGTKVLYNEDVKRDIKENPSLYLRKSAIDFNKAGFDYETETKSDVVDSITVLPTGSSGLLYQIHEGKAGNTSNYIEDSADDIYELSIALPALGNAVAEMWNVVYGPGKIEEKDENGNVITTSGSRNTNIEWNNKDGLRDVTTLAGCINSVHDLMGQIIVYGEEINNEEFNVEDIKYTYPDGEIRTQLNIERQQYPYNDIKDYIYYREDTQSYYRLIKEPIITEIAIPKTDLQWYTIDFEDQYEYYVIKDTTNTFNLYSPWDKNNVQIPSTVTLGKTEPNDEYSYNLNFVELPDLAKSLNTIFGLILNINNILETNNNIIRDEQTVQGCINILHDIIYKFDNLKPLNILSTDAFGRITSIKDIGEFQLAGYDESIQNKNKWNESVKVQRKTGYLKVIFEKEEFDKEENIWRIKFLDENKKLKNSENESNTLSIVIHELNNYTTYYSGQGQYMGDYFYIYDLNGFPNLQDFDISKEYLITRGDTLEPKEPDGYYVLPSDTRTLDYDLSSKTDSLNAALRKLENKANRSKKILANYWNATTPIKDVSIETQSVATSEDVITGISAAGGNELTLSSIKAKDLKLTGYSNKTIENTFKDLQSQVDNALSDINLTQEAVSDKSTVVTALTLDETNGANFKAENSKIGNLKIDNYSQGNKSEKITNTDTINSAFGKLQNQIDNVENNIGTDKLILTNYELGPEEEKNEQITNTDSVDQAFSKLQNQVSAVSRMEVTLGGVGTSGVANENAQIVKSIEFNSSDSSLYQNVDNVGDLELSGYKRAVKRGYFYLNNVLVDDWNQYKDQFRILGLGKNLYKTNETLHKTIKICIFAEIQEDVTSTIINNQEFEAYYDVDDDLLYIEVGNNFYISHGLYNFKITRLEADNEELINPTGYDIVYIESDTTQNNKIQPTDSINEAFGKLQLQIDNKDFDTSSLIGQPGAADNAEIFNDYENNQAIGPYTHASGFETQAGITGYYFSDLIINEDGTGTFYLSEEQGTEKWSDGLEVNYTTEDVVSYVSGSKYLDIGTIQTINGNIVTVKPLEGKVLVKGAFDTGIDDQIFYVKEKPFNGIVPFGHYAVAEGEETKAIERSSHAEGRKTIARGQYGHAEGRKTEAGYAAHAEGYLNKAVGNYSHTEGQSNTAAGQASHAEGNKTQAISDAAHAEGFGTIASARFAHAEGRNTIANIENQHVQGRFNKYLDENDNALNYAHVIGNGSSDSNRSNAYTLDWNGNGWFAGKVTVGSEPIDNMGVVNKGYIQKGPLDQYEEYNISNYIEEKYYIEDIYSIYIDNQSEAYGFDSRKITTLFTEEEYNKYDIDSGQFFYSVFSVDIYNNTEYLITTFLSYNAQYACWTVDDYSELLNKDVNYIIVRSDNQLPHDINDTTLKIQNFQQRKINNSDILISAIKKLENENAALRALINGSSVNIKEAQNTANEAQDTAKEAQNTANEAQDTAKEAYELAGEISHEVWNSINFDTDENENSFVDKPAISLKKVLNNIQKNFNYLEEYYIGNTNVIENIFTGNFEE